MNKITYNSLQQTFSPLGLGCAGISGEGGGYGFGDVSEQEAESLLKKALELGINLFDTAPIYGFGLSEERLGKVFKNSDEVFIISKGGVDWHSNRRVNMTNDPQVIERMMHESLKRLKRDVIDMYLIHWPDPRIDIRHPLEILIRAKEKGKIKFLGLANTNAEDLIKAQEMTALDGFQAEHNLWTQENYKLIETHSKNALFTGWGTFDKGILSGRVVLDRKYESSDARSWAPWWNKKEVELKIKKVESLKKICESYGCTLAEFSLLFAHSTLNPGVPLIGAKSPKDLQSAWISLHNDEQIHKVKAIHGEFQDLEQEL